MIVTRRFSPPVRAELRTRLSPYERARVLRACHDISELLRPLPCAACEAEAPNVRAARVEGWQVEGRAHCPTCRAAASADASSRRAS